MTTKQTKPSFPPQVLVVQKLLTEYLSKHDLPAKPTRVNCFKWIEDELGGLNATEQQRKQVLALAAVLGGCYRSAAASEHCRRLDVILDKMCEWFCPEEWAANLEKSRQMGQCGVFAAVYGSRDYNGLIAGGWIDHETAEQLGGRFPKRDLT